MEKTPKKMTHGSFNAKTLLKTGIWKIVAEKIKNTKGRTPAVLGIQTTRWQKNKENEKIRKRSNYNVKARYKNS